MHILELSREEILALDPNDIFWTLDSKEVIHIAKTLGSFWNYDYDVARRGKVGLHAELKSGLHSDGFFISRILLAPKNVRLIMAEHIVTCLRRKRGPAVDYVAGIPDGATTLGKEVARILGVHEAVMEKKDGKISLLTNVGEGQIIFVEDFCTEGTGIKEAVEYTLDNQPKAIIAPYYPVIINRGGLEYITVPRFGLLKVLAVATHKIETWFPNDCPLCHIGSVAVKPKATEENWLAITTSQK